MKAKWIMFSRNGLSEIWFVGPWKDDEDDGVLLVRQITIMANWAEIRHRPEGMKRMSTSEYECYPIGSIEGFGYDEAQR